MRPALALLTLLALGAPTRAAACTFGPSCDGVTLSRARVYAADTLVNVTFDALDIEAGTIDAQCGAGPEFSFAVDPGSTGLADRVRTMALFVTATPGARLAIDYMITSAPFVGTVCRIRAAEVLVTP